MSLIPFGFWAASGAGGGGGAYDLLETTTLTSSASSVTFSGLGSYSDYAHLQIRAVTRTGVGTYSETLLQFNGDTGSNYSTHRLRGNGSNVTSSGWIADTKIHASSGEQSNSASGAYFAMVLDILDFSSSSKNTTIRSLSGGTGMSNTQDQVALTSGVWVNTAAVTSMEFSYSVDFQAGSRFSLYGIKGA